MQSSFEMAKILFQIVCITASLMWPYLYCYYATFACDRVASIGDTVYNSNWYNQSVEMQRRNILIIAYSQQPVHFTGFNLFPCTLEIFGHVSIKFIPLIFQPLIYYLFYFCSCSENHARFIWFSEVFLNYKRFQTLYKLESLINNKYLFSTARTYRAINTYNTNSNILSRVH